MPTITLPNDAGSSLDFGLDNDLRQTGARSTAAVGNWGAASTIGASAALVVACRIPVRHIGTASYESHSTTLFETAIGASYIKCVYYGAQAPEISYRNRICFFGSDGTHSLGRVPTLSETLTTSGAVRSAQITDSKPRIVKLSVLCTAPGVYTVRVYSLRPGATSVEIGDSFTINCGIAALGLLYVGAPPSPTGVAGDYFCGEISQIMFANGDTGALDLSGVVFARMSELISPLSWPVYLPIKLFYFRGLAGDLVAAPAYWDYTGAAVRRGQRHLAYTHRAFGGVLVDPPTCGTVAGAQDTTLVIPVSYVAEGTVGGEGYTAWIVLQLQSQTGQIFASATTQTGALIYDPVTRQNTAAGFYNVAPGWYKLLATHVTQSTIPGSAPVATATWQASNYFAIGRRVWVLGDALLQRLVDNTDVSLSDTSVNGEILTENTTVTVAEQYATGYFRAPRTISAVDFARAKLKWLQQAFGPSTVPTEYVILATTGDPLAAWLSDATTQGGTHLLSEYAQSFSDYSKFGTSWLLAHDTLDPAFVGTESQSSHVTQLNNLFTTQSFTNCVTLVNNAVLPVMVIPSYRHQSTWDTAPAYGEVTAARVASMRAGRLAWVAQTGSAPVRSQGGELWDYAADYQIAKLTTLPSTAAEWLAFCTNCRSALDGIITADGLLTVLNGVTAVYSLLAQFTNSTRSVIKLYSFPRQISVVGSGNVSHIEVSEDAGSSYTSVGYTAVVSADSITLTKASGGWSSTVGSVRVRYGYGLPVFQPTYPTSASPSVLQAYYRTTQGVLYDGVPARLLSPFAIGVQEPLVGGDVGIRLLAITGIGR